MHLFLYSCFFAHSVHKDIQTAACLGLVWQANITCISKCVPTFCLRNKPYPSRPNRPTPIICTDARWCHYLQQQSELRLHVYWQWKKYTAVWLSVDTPEPQDQLGSAIIQMEADSCSISIRELVSAGRQISFPGFMTYCVVVRNLIKL